ncbi:MAG TPA: DnaJ domain-containing protein [Myxococcales bacterium]|nr:DnaJ domain-containing protein [Myxococcales bacterium]
MATQAQGAGWGKLAGAMVLGVAGALAFTWQGGVAGVIVGLVLGHWFDSRTAAAWDDPDEPRPQAAYEVDEEAQRLFAEEIAAPFAALLAALGKRSADARGALWRYLRDSLGFPEEQLAAAATKLDAALARGGDLVAACEACARRLPKSEHRLLVSALYELARDIGVGAGNARMALRDAAAALGVSEDEEAAIRGLVFGGGEARDYQVLGVAEGASDGDVKTAYRKLAAKLHPDRVAHLGEKAVELATREFDQVRSAYERIRATRGF